MLIKISVFFIFIALQGCQFIERISLIDEPIVNQETRFKNLENEEITTISHLLKQGNQYTTLSNEDSLTLCDQLKNNYKKHNDWETAWHLVYYLNEKFKCIPLYQSLILLNDISFNLSVRSPLFELNKNQIKLFKMLSYLKTNNLKNKKKQHYLQEKLAETESELKSIISKVQALKLIETTINQKNLQ